MCTYLEVPKQCFFEEHRPLSEFGVDASEAACSGFNGEIDGFPSLVEPELQR